MISAREERLADKVRDKKRDATRAAVLVRGFHHRPQIRFGRHVADRVMNEHHVEGAAESQCANVALNVLALWVELPTYREHLGRKIHQGHREMRLEVERAVA